MNKYYISLVRGLTGYYVVVLADNEDIVRAHAAMYYGRLWCSVYSEVDFQRLCAKYASTTVINESRPVELGGSELYE